jgi:hypothetical protein
MSWWTEDTYERERREEREAEDARYERRREEMRQEEAAEERRALEERRFIEEQGRQAEEAYYEQMHLQQQCEEGGHPIEGGTDHCHCGDVIYKNGIERALAVLRSDHDETETPEH